MAKYSDAPPTISLELVPAETYFRDEDTSLAAVGLEDQTFKFGSLSTYAAVGASTAADFKFKEVGYQSELFFQHVFNPLGSIPMPSLWGFSFVGNAINELTVANDLADLDWPSLDFTQTSAVGLFKYVEGHGRPRCLSRFPCLACVTGCHRRIAQPPNKSENKRSPLCSLPLRT